MRLALQEKALIDGAVPPDLEAQSISCLGAMIDDILSLIIEGQGASLGKDLCKSLSQASGLPNCAILIVFLSQLKDFWIYEISNLISFFVLSSCS